MERQKYPLLGLSVALLLLSLMAGCAKQGYPSGGPVDRIPPKIEAVTPPSGSNNFAGKEFVLLMDEYVTIKDADNNILVSPPMKQKPEYTVRGRKVEVHIFDTLLENTTYLFQFKGAIVDFNEGNPLPSFEYVFSTGESIDSMTLRGRVVDALTLKAPKENVSVLAYDGEASDSAVALEQPHYFTRCDTGGRFTFNHIAAGRYRIFALVDGDRNLRLNPGEAVAFLDSAVTAVPMPKAVPKDTAAVVADSSRSDSTSHYGYIKPDNIPMHLMHLSTLKVEQQRVTGSKALSAGHFQIVTKTPLTDSFALTHLMADNTLQLYTRRNAQGDTLDVWTAPERLDSIVLLLTDDTMLHDTLSLQFRKRTIGKTSASQAPERLKVQSLVAQNHPYFDTLRLGLGAPVMTVDGLAAVRVMNMSDSTVTTCAIHLQPNPWDDTAYAFAVRVDFQGKAGEKYQLTLPAEVLTDVYGNKNDSLVITTTYTKSENYGGIMLSVETDRIAAGGQLLVQLLNEKGDMLRQEVLTNPGIASFPHLKAGKYSFRLVNDSDGNGQWTPGDYWSGRQPEEVIYFDKVLELRENWDINERFRW